MWYYIDNQGQQQGPISAEALKELASQGLVLPQSLVWTDGLEQWVEARTVDGLFSTPAVQTPVVIPSPTASQPIQIATAPLISSTPTTSPIKGIAAVQPNPYSAPATASPVAAPEGEYPATITKGGSFGLIILLYLSCFILAFIGSLLGQQQGGNPTAALAVMVLACAISLYSGILFYIYLYRAWAALRPGGGTISPGKAVGFMFIPFFNIVWIFICFSRLAKEWNAITASYQNTQNAPKFTPWAFICVGIPFINLIAFFIAIPQLCRGITFMANLSKPKLTTSQGGGLNFGPSSIKR